MRINDRLVIQQVDDQIVFISDQTGQEVTWPVAEIPDLIRDMSDADPDVPGGFVLATLSGTFRLFHSELVQVGFALGYFWGVNR